MMFSVLELIIFENSLDNQCLSYIKMTKESFLDHCKILQRVYLASKASAMIPAASGAEALVPVCERVQPFGTSTVT